MSSLLGSIWSWITGQPEVPELPSNIFFEKDVTSDNDFWISCILNPKLEVKYINGIVTKLLDSDKCLIDDIYHYQPKTEKEIRNFPYIEINTPVRISLYRKKNSNAAWNVASCIVSKDGPRHQATRIKPVESIQDHLYVNELTVQIDEKNGNDDDLSMTIEVLGDMPIKISLEEESTIQILFRNNSYIKEQKLLDYRTMQGNREQLSIISSKIKLPLVIHVCTDFVFDIAIKGKYVGRSTEKVEFIFEDTTYKVGINIDVTDSRILIPVNAGYFIRKEVDMQRLLELQNESIIPGVRCTKRLQFHCIRLGKWDCPSQLNKCFWTENGKFNYTSLKTEVKENIQKFYPAAFEILTYQNYKAKFHTLLFVEEIEINVALQKYANEKINFEHAGEYLVLNIPDLSEQRPSIIPGDRCKVEDPPNCTKRLGGRMFEGIIHRVLADKLWLKFDPEFHGLCGHWDYSVHFSNTRTMYRKQHEMIHELWNNNRLGESFLFPFKDSMEYQPPKLKILSDEMDVNINNEENLNAEGKTPLLPQPKVVEKIRWFNEKLNPEQKTAVINILKGEGRPMPYIIYGPPGTGKTITLTESIIQVYKQFPKSKLLICAPTNAAVDMLLSKLINSGLFDNTVMKRLVGYNYYISLSYNTDYDDYCVLPELENSNQGQDNETDSKLIKKRDILKLRIVISTEGTAGLLYMMGLKCGTFTHIFIDEAGQSTEPELLIPLSFLDPRRDGQVVLAGDPKQLGPVVMSLLAKSSGLGQSMLARFINYPSYQRSDVIFPENNGFNPKVITHLIRNYRSLPEIVHNYNKLFYNSLLVPTKLGDDVPERIFLKDLNENGHWDIGCKGPVIVHGIVGEDNQEPSSPSWFNPHEAFQVLLYITRLMKAGVSANDIGVITPYASQVTKINELLKMYYPDVTLPKVGTVEMFQGQERLVIIISIVRSGSTNGRQKDDKFNLGFLVAKERTNVAWSRAKALVIIIGNPSTMRLNKQWKYIFLQAIRLKNYTGCTVPEDDISNSS